MATDRRGQKQTSRGFSCRAGRRAAPAGRGAPKRGGLPPRQTPQRQRFFFSDKRSRKKLASRVQVELVSEKQGR